jgi:outer membrane protein OmpA-like peptidoglycan-associated protein
MQFRGALLAATVLAAAPFAASAQPVTGLYVGAGAGVNFRQDENIKGLAGVAGPGAGLIFGSGFGGVPLGVGTSLNKQYDVGYVGVISLGWGFGNGLRVELEGNARDNRVSKITGTPFPTNSGGNEVTYGAMVNALYDFDIANWTGGKSYVFPYIGVGAGYAWTNYDSLHSYGTNFPYFYKSNDTDGNFAYQAIAGVSFPLEAVPGLSLTAEYRFFGVLDGAKYNGSIDTGFNRTFVATKAGDQYNHSILFGVRYAFNAAAPPPPAPAPVAAPAPAPARSYLVFFDWDRADLTGRARQIIREAAENSTRVQYTRIEVNGYTDTSGTPAYNQRLSVRRAQNVAAELVRDGVPRNAISIQGFGETHLLVPTGPGVREPQNRRVEIIIR